MDILTDEDLIKNIKCGDEAAENELLTRYKDLVVKICRSYFIVGGEMEDTIQEGMIGLYRAIKGYDNDKSEAKFKTYAITCIKHQIHNAIKKANTNKQKALTHAVSFQSFSNSETGETLDYIPMELVFEDTPAVQLIDKEAFLELKKKIKDLLSPLELKVLNLYLMGYSYKEISSRLDVNKKSIDNHIARIKIKLRKNLDAHP